MLLNVQKNLAEGFEETPSLLSFVKESEPQAFHTTGDAQFTEMFFKDKFNKANQLFKCFIQMDRSYTYSRVNFHKSIITTIVAVMKDVGALYAVLFLLGGMIVRKHAAEA